MCVVVCGCVWVDVCVWLFTESSDEEAGQPSHCWCLTGMLVRSETFLFPCRDTDHPQNTSHTGYWLSYVVSRHLS